MKTIETFWGYYYHCKDIFNTHFRLYSGTCRIRHTKGPGKCVGLYRISEYLGFILVNKNTVDHTFLSDVTECQKTRVSDCTSSTVLWHILDCIVML